MITLCYLCEWHLMLCYDDIMLFMRMACDVILWWHYVIYANGMWCYVMMTLCYLCEWHVMLCERRPRPIHWPTVWYRVQAQTCDHGAPSRTPSVRRAANKRKQQQQQWLFVWLHSMFLSSRLLVSGRQHTFVYIIYTHIIYIYIYIYIYMVVQPIWKRGKIPAKHGCRQTSCRMLANELGNLVE